MEGSLLTIAGAIVSGVLVFVLSHLYVETWLKPRVELSGMYARLNSLFLENSARIFSSEGLSRDSANALRAAGTEILVQGWRIYRRAKKRQHFLKIARELNLITGTFIDGTRERNIETRNAMKELERIDKNIKTTFEG